MKTATDINDKQELVIYQTEDGSISIDVKIDNETVWLSQKQMIELFGRDQSVISRHINNVFKENEVDKKSNMQFMHIANADRPVAFYSLDVIISVGYRIKSQQGTRFRIWANQIIKDYILQGYAINQQRLNQLNTAIKIMKRTVNQLDARQVLDVIEMYSSALGLLDDYDHRSIKKPEGKKAIQVIDYEECRNLINGMKYKNESDLFGNEKDESFKGAISAIYQTFGGLDVYPSLEEKAANLLYFITKDHCFSDGNKRIAAAIFLYFLDKNQALFEDGQKRIEDHTLVALIIMIAESQRQEKEMMVRLVMNFIS